MIMMMMMMVMKWLLNDWLSPQQVVHITWVTACSVPHACEQQALLSLCLYKSPVEITQKIGGTYQKVAGLVRFYPSVCSELRKSAYLPLFCFVSFHHTHYEGRMEWICEFLWGGISFLRSSSQLFSTFKPISTEVNYLDIWNQDLR